MSKIKKSLNSNKACLLLIGLVLGATIVSNDNSNKASARTPSSLSSPTKEYTFKYKLKGEDFEVKVKNKEWDESLAHAAQLCFDHFKGGKKLSETQGLDIIDVCANPR